MPHLHLDYRQYVGRYFHDLMGSRPFQGLLYLLLGNWKQTWLIEVESEVEKRAENLWYEFVLVFSNADHIVHMILGEL